MQWVVRERAFDYPRVTHKQGAVQALDRLFAGQTWSQQFSPSREAEHEMGLDKSQGDMQITLDKPPVNQDPRARTGRAQIRMRGLVAGVMGRDRIMTQDLWPDDFL